MFELNINMAHEQKPIRVEIVHPFNSWSEEKKRMLYGVMIFFMGFFMFFFFLIFGIFLPISATLILSFIFSPIVMIVGLGMVVYYKWKSSP